MAGHDKLYDKRAEAAFVQPRVFGGVFYLLISLRTPSELLLCCSQPEQCNKVDTQRVFAYDFPMKINQMIQVSIFAVLTAVGARLMIPIPFVPFTLQTLVCISAGLLLGAKLGAASQALYLIMGLIGIPVFTAASGPAAVLMPSFGYAVGFIPGAWLAGFIAERFRAEYGTVTKRQYFTASLAGTLVIYAIGLSYLYAALNLWVNKGGAAFMTVISIGFLSTIGGDLVKCLLASALAERLQQTGLFAIMTQRAEKR